MFTYLFAILVVLVFWFLIGFAVDLVTNRPYYPGHAGIRSELLQWLKKNK